MTQGAELGRTDCTLGLRKETMERAGNSALVGSAEGGAAIRTGRSPERRREAERGDSTK